MWMLLTLCLSSSSVVCCVAFYLWQEQLCFAGWTFALLLPGSLVQVLSFRWYRADGDTHTCHNFIIHTLHLGIFRRLWSCMKSQAEQVQFGAVLIQQADVSVLCLIEALTLSLPQSLLQTYSLFTLHPGLLSPVALCSGVCLLSLSWALVLYSRACCLIRPGHLQMPPAALLSQLLWRTGMLAARFTSLALFTRTFGCWLIGVIASHWLMAALWLVSQQTDIYVGQWSWRVFNFILGGVHVFLFLNVKDGPSRFRMAGFYTVMLLENVTLLLAASEILIDASWDSLTIPTAVLCSFLLGLTSLILYYRFLHPKSTEISQGLHQRAHMGRECLQQADSSFSLGDKHLPPAALPVLFRSSHPSFSLSGIPGSLLEHPGSCGVKPDGECRHHHWLLIRLALKTGDPVKINSAYGAGGVSGILAVDQKAEMIDDGCISASESRDDTMAPLSDCREEFESMSEAKDDDDEDDSLEMESPLESPVTLSDCKRSSPEGKSVFGDSPEPNYCPTESSSTLYFSADPQSPSSSSNPRLDRETPFSFGSGTGLETLDELSPISTDGGLHRDLVRGLLGRAGPCYTSAPRLNGEASGYSPGALAGRWVWPGRGLRMTGDCRGISHPRSRRGQCS
ncbi:XK-related protein 5a precursor [Danio rerio]|uniref:XK-related protein n=1 Tax=Danio rerio TaxID=7955 RepID=Q5GH41_DANRE|nr:XK-related protein 5a precursor [Danio rerio]AAT07125.1 XK-related protein 5 [Danio rerio]|eukprot:NP_001012260.1 XK related 5a precursor [Danio rerio]